MTKRRSFPDKFKAMRSTFNQSQLRGASAKPIAYLFGI